MTFRYSPEIVQRPATVDAGEIERQLHLAYGQSEPVRPLTLDNGSYALTQKAARRSPGRPMPGSILA